MKQVGLTPEGVRVYDGVFKLYDTHGVPLDVVISELHARQALPCWFRLYEDACTAGWKPARVIAWITSAVRDSLHPHADEIVSRVALLPEYSEAKARV